MKSKFEIILDKGVDLTVGFYRETLAHFDKHHTLASFLMVFGCCWILTIGTIYAIGQNSVGFQVLSQHYIDNFVNHEKISESYIKNNVKNICENYIKEHIEEKKTPENLNLKSE